MKVYKKYFPPHIYQGNTIYFITAHTFDRVRFFDTEIKKGILAECLNEAAKNYKIDIYGYALMSNHYHLLCFIQDKSWLPKFIKAFHGKSAILINKHDLKPARKIWINYFDRCVRSEKDFYARLNYIHQNPVKHKYASKMQNYRFSSYNHYLKKFGTAWLNDSFEKYPIIDFTVKDNGQK